MTASVPAAGEGPDPAASLAAIEAQQHQTVVALRPSPLAIFLSWGVAYIVAFGAVWLGIAPHDALPGWLVAALVAMSLVGAVTSTVVSVIRSGRGVAGRSRRVGAMYGWSWFAGLSTMVLVNERLETLGVPDATMSLVWSASALLVVGLLTLAGGVLFDAPAQYALGIWVLVSAVAVALVGFPANFLVLALAGGGGFVALGVVTHLRTRRSAA